MLNSFTAMLRQKTIIIAMVLLLKEKGPLNVRVQTFLRPEEGKNTAGVTLCTMHSSKGLEFDNVVVVQCNSGNVPSAKSDSVEEERRLF